ncbi:acyl-CoA dehydrogenase family protein [Futiania mangrovi]|uniref:Acyl-CoA dehydrogenase family protein n=1 Tax=Futiania mangrovi TaxID=2959716 RepID=A0A9J6P8B3_9PROT|nr:acyl-CoA dehydrogenase family protein [Futiania mangrovii]MCP1335852.1 acyl-CoA dehydrogenase family protein [Futiania mangrovii]
MDFSFTEEQEMLRESLSRMLADAYSFDVRRKIVASEEGFSREIWGKLAELGVFAMPFAEEDGGLGGGAVDTMVVMEELGRALVIEPYLATVVLAGGLLRHAGSAEQRAAHIGAIVGGEGVYTAGLYEAAGRFDPFHVAAKAEKTGDGYRLTGEKTFVPFGGAADHLIVSARVSGATADRDGIGLFLVPASAAGLTRRPYRTVDGARAAEVRLDGVEVGADAVLGTPGKAADVIAAVVDEATAAVCGEAVGVMTRLHELTLDYAKERKQFGQPISRFQVIQHQLVEMMIAKEEAISTTYMGTLKLGGNAGERARAVSAAKAMAGKSGRALGQTAIQVHGGMGMTWEMTAPHYFKRLTAIEQAFGDTEWHLKRFSSAGRTKAAA